MIFICSIWPMLINTAFGVSAVRREWLNVARTLEVSPLRKAFQVVLPAAAPTIMTGMRISVGIAWLVIVAAEMLVGGTGIGYFVWNEWNNLSISNILCAILLIGLVGMLLDQILARLQRAPSPIRSERMSANFSRSKGLPNRSPGRGGAPLVVFDEVNFAINKGEFVCIIGHSGCGKPTILNMLAGLDEAERRRGHHGRPRSRRARASTAAWCSRATR